jgi:hypothetical protein
MTVGLYYGIIRVRSTNSSNNECTYFSSFYLYPSSNGLGNNEIEESNKDTYLSYSNIANNHATSDRCIEFTYYKCDCNKCNIINNYQNTNTYGTIFIWSSTTTISECCFKGNNYNGNDKGKLFYVYSGSLTISNSNIDNFSSNKDTSSIISGNIYNDIFFDRQNWVECMLIILKHKDTPNLKCKCTINIQMISISLLLNHFLIEDE